MTKRAPYLFILLGGGRACRDVRLRLELKWLRWREEMRFAGELLSHAEVRQAVAVARSAVVRTNSRATSCWPACEQCTSSGKWRSAWRMLESVSSGESSRNGDIPLQQKFFLYITTNLLLIYFMYMCLQAYMSLHTISFYHFNSLIRINYHHLINIQ